MPLNSKDIRFLEEAGDLRGKKVLLAVDLNMPVGEGGEVTDNFRFRRFSPTLKFLKDSGAVALLVGHLANKESDRLSLRPVSEYFRKFFPIRFADNLGAAKVSLAAAAPGEFVMLDNLRRFKGETENDEFFAKSLTELADIYVNEAFSVSHRAHASIVGAPKLLSGFAGFLFREELERLSAAFRPPKPFLFILAGAKFETKFPLLKKFLLLADSVFVGGALANDLMKARGVEIGRSMRSPRDLGFAEVIYNSKLILPSDVVTENAGETRTKTLEEILPSDSIFDAGPETVARLRKKFFSAKFILWNGTLGSYERGFAEGSEALARAIIESGAESIVGGGDTIACVSKLGLLDKFSFVSTGGGAMLEFLANETLPGIEALKQSALKFGF